MYQETKKFLKTKIIVLCEISIGFVGNDKDISKQKLRDYSTMTTFFIY